MMKITEDVTCLGCGCLCDDLRVTSEAGRVSEAARACEIGVRWFLGPGPGEGFPASTIEGQASEFTSAIDRAAALLAGAKAPVIWGLSGSTVEDVASALKIADTIGAVVDLAGSPSREARLKAFQRVGQVSCSLGEVKARADLVVFWGVDPLTTHPRHGERYSIEPEGRFLPVGRSVIVIGHEPTPTAAVSELCVHVPPDRWGETLWTLRAMVKDISLDPDRVERSTGCCFEALEDLAGRLREARYGAFFFGPSMGEGPEGSWVFEAALSLVSDLNEGRRFVALNLGSPGNPGGAEAVMAWQSGAPSALDFGRGFPRHLPDEATLVRGLTSGEVDAVLIVGDDPQIELTPGLLERLAQVPTVWIAPGATSPGFRPTVGLATSRPGIESGGTVARSDGVMLPLRPSIETDRPDARKVLELISNQIQKPDLSPDI